MLISVLPTLAVVPSHEVTVAGCREDASPGIHLITPGLLQLNVIRHHRQLVSALTIVQNATARLITGVQRKDHITPILQQLHWLPVRERVIFKHTLLVCKALHGLLPPYLAHDCQLLADTGRRQLRSSDVATCSVLWTHSSLGDRCFAVRGWTENMEQFAYQIATIRPQP